MFRINKHRIVFFAIALVCMQSAYAQDERVYTLSELCELAAANSSQLKLAQTASESSKEATRLAKNAHTPSIDLSLSASYIGNGFVTDRNFSNLQNVDMPHFGNNFGIEASQVIFAGKAISSGIQKARLEEQVAMLNYSRNELDIRFLITGFYLDLYKLDNQREIFAKNIEQTQLLIDQIRSKESQGMALGSDITRHELMLQNYKLALIEIENNRSIINNQMTTTLGLPETTKILPDTTIISRKYNIQSAGTLVDSAALNLPEIKLAALSKTIADKELTVAKSAYYPQIALVAANHFDGPILIEVPTINSNFNYWYVGIGLQYNIASLYRSKKGVRMAKHRQNASVHAESLAMEQMRISVHNAYTKYNEAIEKLSVYQTSLRLANENYSIINSRYLNELVLITEMLDASNTRLNAELQVVNAKLDVIYNYYKLQRQIGKKITE